MRAAGGQVVAGQGRAEVGPLRRGAHEENLVQKQFAVEDVAAGDARDALDVDRRDDLLADDGAADVGRVTLERGDDRLGEGFFFGIVPAAFEIVGRVLHEAGSHMLPGRGHVRVDHRREDHVDVRLARKLAVLGVVVGALDVVDAGADGYRAAMQFGVARERCEIGQF